MVVVLAKLAMGQRTGAKSAVFQKYLEDTNPGWLSEVKGHLHEPSLFELVSNVELQSALSLGVCKSQRCPQRSQANRPTTTV